MLRCQEVSRLIASGEVERSGWIARARVWFHLRMCEHCRRYAAQIQGLGRAARDVLQAEEPDREAEARLERSLLDGIRSGRPTDPPPGDEATGVEPPPRPVD